MSNEIFNQKNVIVDDTQLKVGNETFMIRNIGSVEITDHFNAFSTMLLILAALSIFGACTQTGFLGTGFIFAVICVILAFVINGVSKKKANLYLKIGTNKSTRILSDPDKKFVQDVKEAIEKAISKTGVQ